MHMKKAGNSYKPDKKDKRDKVNIEPLQKKDFYILTAIFFILSFFYFFVPADHILSFQEEQFLFLFSGDYLNGFLDHPGGLLEYAGRFLMQFYSFPFAGSLLIAIALTLPGILAFMILKKLNANKALLLPFSVMPSILLMLMQNQYYHYIEYNLGFICIPAYFLVTFRFRKYYLHIILFPLLFYVAGAYALIYACMDVIFSIAYTKGAQKTYAAILPVIALLTFIVFQKFLFLVPANTLFTYPLPLVHERFHRGFFIALTAYTVLFPLLIGTRLLIDSAQTRIRYTGTIFAGLFLALCALFLTGMYDPSISSVMHIQKYAYKGDWDKLIRTAEGKNSDNLMSQYFYNTALSEKDMLCEKLFTTDQRFGTKGLILPWGDQYLERGAYFFYTSGLVNEAHRWAYEEMVVYGKRPHNIQMLIKTNILDGNLRMAYKYIDILKKTAFYRDEAEKYEKLAGNEEAVISDPELGPIAAIMPEKDFFIYMDSPEDNLPMLFESNPKNRRAFEYMLSWLLLEKDVETVLSNLHLFKEMGYTSIPRPVEEAIMIYYDSQKKFPDMFGLTVSPATLTRFRQYFSSFVQARNNPALLQQTMKEKFGDTFWYYYHFHK